MEIDWDKKLQNIMVKGKRLVHNSYLKFNYCKSRPFITVAKWLLWVKSTTLLIWSEMFYSKTGKGY